MHAIAVHAWPGAWGCIASGLFATDSQLSTLGYVAQPGLLYSGDGAQFGAQLVGTLAVLAWTAATSGIVFWSLRRAGLLRVSPEAEAMGVDAAEHGQISQQPKNQSTSTEAALVVHTPATKEKVELKVSNC